MSAKLCDDFSLSSVCHDGMFFTHQKLKIENFRININFVLILVQVKK
jgi:hypothetical protein